MPYLDNDIKNRIETNLKLLNELRPLPAISVKKLQEQFQIEMTYNSNGIEGNSLTLKETFLVINEGITIKGKPLKDHLEAKDHKEALEFLYEIVSKTHKPTISEKLIRDFNTLVMKKTDEDWAGKYRTSSVIIGGADHTPPAAIKLPADMKDLIDWYKLNSKTTHIIELAAILHHKLTFIHPFFDGNGRTSRLIMNVLLMREGYPLAIILKNDRSKYYRVLASADKGDYTPLVSFIAQAVERSLDIYLKTLTPMNKKIEHFLPLAQVSKRVPYSVKYLNLLARTGKIKAHKVKRNWVTSVDAVEKYMAGRTRVRDFE